VSGTPELLNLDTLQSMAADAAVSAYADADIRENFSDDRPTERQRTLARLHTEKQLSLLT
jgi:hypothetical protein